MLTSCQRYKVNKRRHSSVYTSETLLKSEITPDVSQVCMHTQSKHKYNKDTPATGQKGYDSLIKQQENLYHLSPRPTALSATSMWPVVWEEREKETETERTKERKKNE